MREDIREALERFAAIQRGESIEKVYFSFVIQERTDEDRAINEIMQIDQFHRDAVTLAKAFLSQQKPQ